jgi:hypothetical protein
MNIQKLQEVLKGDVSQDFVPELGAYFDIT